ncbi:MAG TPA: MFS transporter, partial [Noviherbaspirillum sp.]
MTAPRLHCLSVFASIPLLQLILVALAAHIALTGVRITTSLYALSLHASEFTVGSLMALFSLFPMMLAVPAGRLIDRIGIVRPMLAGCASIAAGCAVPGFIGGLPVLYLAAILTGSGFMMIQIAAQHTVGAISAAHQRASHFSRLALGFSISGFCGPVIAGFIIDQARYSAAYITFFVFALLALALTAYGQTIKIPAAAHEESPSSGNAIGLLRDREMRRIYLIGTLLASAWDLFTFVLPIHGSQLGFSASTIGLILGCFSVATFIVRLGMPWIARRWSEWHVLTAALMLAGFCYALFPLMEQPASIMAVAALLGAAVGSSQPNMLALLHHAAPSGRAAEAVGVRIT